MKREARLVLKECRLSIENTSTKQNKYVGNQKLSILLISISKNCLVESVFFLFIDMFLYSHEADFIQGLLQKNEKKLAWSFNFTFCYRWCPFTNLSHWACNKGYSYICFIPWPTPRNWQWRPLKSKTLRQKRWFQFSHCEHSTRYAQNRNIGSQMI
jgi:hypothetical protein